MDDFSEYMDFDMAFEPTPDPYFSHFFAHDQPCSYPAMQGLVLGDIEEEGNDINFNGEQPHFTPLVSSVNALPMTSMGWNIPPSSSDHSTFMPSAIEEEGNQNTHQNLSLSHNSHRAPRQNPQVTKKRAPKASMMTKAKWRSCEARIKELYVREGKSQEEVREIVNEEYGFTATLRQYKGEIQRLNIDKNVKETERNKIIRNVKRRRRVGKNTSVVRVRGHQIDSKKLSRWEKDLFANNQPPTSDRSLSPVPSYISLFTDFPPHYDNAMSCIASDPGTLNGRMNQGRHEADVLRRLCAHSNVGQIIADPGTVRDIFNDLQRVLSSDHTAWRPLARGFKSCQKYLEFTWNPKIQEDITRLRNLMNSEPNLIIGRGPLAVLKHNRLAGNQNQELLSWNRKHPIEYQSRRQSSWTTEFGTIHAFFGTYSANSGKTNKIITTSLEKGQAFTGKVVIVPKDFRFSRSYISFDFMSKDSSVDLWAKLTYSPMIPNDSKVFSIIRDGEVNELIQHLEEGYASLSDRDEEGRSLLNYACEYMRGEICEFLVKNNADVNSIEWNRYGSLEPVFSMSRFHNSGASIESLIRMEVCTKVMLEAGADLSLSLKSNDLSLGVLADFLIFKTSSLFACAIDLEMTLTDCNKPQRLVADVLEPPLITLMRCSGYEGLSYFSILDKAIILLKKKFDVFVRGAGGDTILHAVLWSQRYYQERSKGDTWAHYDRWQFKLSLRTPVAMLALGISAGADIFAMNDDDETPYMVAKRLGHMREWREALRICGYDLGYVEEHCHPIGEKCFSDHRQPSLTFDECCRRLEKRNLPPEGDHYSNLWEDVCSFAHDLGNDNYRLGDSEEQFCECSKCRKEPDKKPTDSKMSDDDRVSISTGDDNSTDLPGESAEPRDDVPDHTHGAQLLDGGADTLPRNPDIDREEINFFDLLDDEAVDTENQVQSHINDLVDLDHNPFADDLDLGNVENGMETGTASVGEFATGNISVEDLYDFDAYFGDPERTV